MNKVIVLFFIAFIFWHDVVHLTVLLLALLPIARTMQRSKKRKPLSTRIELAKKTWIMIMTALPANTYQVLPVAVVAPLLLVAGAPAKPKAYAQVPVVSGLLEQDVFVNKNNMENKEEKVFYQDGNVTVTQSRFVANSKTYAMRNISSVSLFKKERSIKFEVALVILGVILLLSESSRLFGAIMLILGIALLLLLKDSYSVRIQSNSGEADGFISKDKALIEKIVGAVNEAIIFRG